MPTASRIVTLGLALFLAGCASPFESVVVNLPPYETGRGERASPAVAPSKIRIEPVKDARSGDAGRVIGQRTTIGQQSMGMIEMEPLPADAVAQLLRTEFTRMGHGIVDAAEQFKVGARLSKFEIATPATAVYWDINGQVELDLTVAAQDGNKRDARYAATCTDRTYTWPGEEIIGKVVAACLASVGAHVRGDAALATFIAGR